MTYEEILEIGKQVTDKIIDEIDAEYNEMGKRKGVYEITGKHKATWIHRMTVLFEADGFEVDKIDETMILVR